MSDSAEFVVRCRDFTKTFQTREAALRWIETVEESGHCQHEHMLEEWVDVGTRKPYFDARVVPCPLCFGQLSPIRGVLTCRDCGAGYDATVRVDG